MMKNEISPADKQIDPVVEAVARALCTTYGSMEHWTVYIIEAKAAISAHTAALKEQGPIEPTEAMWDAATKYAMNRGPIIAPSGVMHGYEAVLKAAQENTSQ